MVSSIGFLVVTTSSFLAFKLGYKNFAYHLLVLGVCFDFMYVIVNFGLTYFSLLLLYPAGIIFCFIFFENTLILVSYLLFFIFNEFIIIYYFSGVHESGDFAILRTEYVNTVAYNVSIFAMCYFFLNNLKRYSQNLDVIKNDLDIKEKFIAGQTQELSNKNIQMSKYIESNLQLENFAHLASHELKSPLRGVTNFVALLERRAGHKLSDKEIEYMDLISLNTKKMNSLIEDLTELGKVSSTDIKIEKVQIRELINDVIVSKKVDITRLNAQVTLKGEVSTINGHRALLTQLFSNLIANALKFSHDDADPVIIIESSEEADYWVFQVNDNGIGIDKEFREDIFKIYQRLHSEAEYKGSGIGLSICKKIVELHRGTIWVEDSDLGGSSFIVRLPI